MEIEVKDDYMKGTVNQSILSLETIKLQQENRQLKEQIEYLERSIERKESTIIELEQEKVPYTNEYVKKLEHKIRRSVDILKKHLEAKSYGNHKYELFDRKYLEDLLKILDTGEKHE